MFKEFIALFGRLASGAVFIFIAYSCVERYRAQSQFRNIYGEHQLDVMADLWRATDRYGASVLEACSSTEDTATLSAKVKGLAQDYWHELSRAGLFLGQEKIDEYRERIGDRFIDRMGLVIDSDWTERLRTFLVEFRKEWVAVLSDLKTSAAPD